MTSCLLITAALPLAAAAVLGSADAGQREGAATFRSGVDVVRVSVVVRDERGRPVDGLTARDLEVLDDGVPRTIADFRQDRAGISIAMLFDVSGSMEQLLPQAREAAEHLLSWLEPADEAAIFTFDTQLEEVAPFTAGLTALPPLLSRVTPFGATAMHDAVAQTARRVGEREGRRRAVVVMSDGRDNASRLAPAHVSGLASAIDVPVYVFATVPSIDNPSTELGAHSPRSPHVGAMSELAVWTGGAVFVASTPAARSLAARQIVDELRHQYVIAFEAGGKPGWHPLEVRARDRDLTVRARSGYMAGRFRPSTE